MRHFDKRLPSPALVVAAIALVTALSGSAVALPGSGTVDANDIKRGAVQSQAIHHRAVTTQKIQRQAVRGGKLARNAVKAGKIRNGAVKPGKLADGAVTDSKLAAGAVSGDEIADNSIGDSKLQDVGIIRLTKLNATPGANFDAARSAAPTTELYKSGPLSLHAKCFTDTTSDVTYAYVYGATSAAGSILVSAGDSLQGNPFLDPGTDEEDREIFTSSAGNNAPSGFRNQFQMAALDGTQVHGLIAMYAKNGDLTGGNGIYGAGDVCMFSGSTLG